QRVRVAIDEPAVAWALDMLRQARETAAARKIPPPLVDSPKCPRCSLVGICLPDETAALRIHRPTGRLVQRTLFESDEPLDAQLIDRASDDSDVRRLVPARDDLRPLYVNTQGLRI